MEVQDLTQLAGKGAYPEAMDRMSVAQRAAKLETEPNHYAVLGVPSTATTADIKQAFRWECIRNSCPSPLDHLIIFCWYGNYLSDTCEGPVGSHLRVLCLMGTLLDDDS